MAPRTVGRGGRIRTGGPLRPRQVRYQAALRPDFTDSLDSSAFRETSSLNAARSTGHSNVSEVAALDDATQAMAWLERAYDERPTRVIPAPSPASSRRRDRNI